MCGKNPQKKQRQNVEECMPSPPFPSRKIIKRTMYNSQKLLSLVTLTDMFLF